MKVRAASVCLAVAVCAVCAQARAEDASAITARGNEPSWSLTVNEIGLRLAAAGQPDFSAPAVTREQQPDGVSRITAVAAGRTVQATFRPGLCADTMSGMPFPANAAVEVDGVTLVGCAGTSAEALRGEWRIATIGGSAPDAGSKPVLDFDAGQVSGTAGCNRIGGEAKLTGEGLSFGLMRSTMMACETTLMKQERAVLDILEKVRHVTVVSSDTIALTPDAGPGVQLVRMR